MQMHDTQEASASITCRRFFAWVGWGSFAAFWVMATPATVRFLFPRVLRIGAFSRSSELTCHGADAKQRWNLWDAGVGRHHRARARKSGYSSAGPRSALTGTIEGEQ